MSSGNVKNPKSNSSFKDNKHIFSKKWVRNFLLGWTLSTYLFGLGAEKGDIYSSNLRLRLSDFAHGTKNVLPAFSRENSIIQTQWRVNKRRLKYGGPHKNFATKKFYENFCSNQVRPLVRWSFHFSDNFFL